MLSYSNPPSSAATGAAGNQPASAVPSVRSVTATAGGFLNLKKTVNVAFAGRSFRFLIVSQAPLTLYASWMDEVHIERQNVHYVSLIDTVRSRLPF